jgi:hypothetical protein
MSLYPWCHIDWDACKSLARSTVQPCSGMQAAVTSAAGVAAETRRTGNGRRNKGGTEKQQGRRHGDDE